MKSMKYSLLLTLLAGLPAFADVPATDGFFVRFACDKGDSVVAPLSVEEVIYKRVSYSPAVLADVGTPVAVNANEISIDGNVIGTFDPNVAHCIIDHRFTYLVPVISPTP